MDRIYIQHDRDLSPPEFCLSGSRRQRKILDQFGKIDYSNSWIRTLLNKTRITRFHVKYRNGFKNNRSSYPVVT